MRMIDADELKFDLKRYFTEGTLDGVSAKLVFNQILHDIDNAPTVEYPFYQEAYQTGYEEGQNERPQGEWYKNIPKGCLKARHGDYVLYKVDFLLDNLAREVNIMEGARRMRGGAE